MKFIDTAIKGVYQVEPTIHEDNRGQFFRLACLNEFQQIGVHQPFVQTNISINTQKGTLRGMHFQTPPSKEGKLVTCIQGAAFDVIVDLRKNSPSFLQWISVELNADNKHLIYLPAGCAHGFISLQDHTQLLYHHTDFYNPTHEAAFRYNDPTVNIQWPMEPIVISDRDLSHEHLAKNFNGLDYEL